MKCKLKKKISKKDVNTIIKAYARENKGKYGSNEQMLEDLREHFAKEKTGIKKGEKT